MSDRIKAKVRFAFKSKTFSEWESENPVLLAGEHGVVTDGTGMEREKIGDGVTAWNNLPWWKVDSPYETALKNGFKGTESQWIASLKGEKGDKGDKGDKGEPGTPINVDVDYNPESLNGQSGKAVASAIENKLDKQALSNRRKAGDCYDNIGLYAAIDIGSGDKQAILTANQSATENTIPVRDGNGSINCKIAIKDSSGNNFTGAAAPHTWVNDRLNSLNASMNDSFAGISQRIDSNDTSIGAIKRSLDLKQVTVKQIEAGKTARLEPNKIYAFLKNGSSNKCSIGLADDVSGTNFEAFNSGTDDEITMKFGIVIIPNNTMGASAEYPPAYYCVAVIDKTIALTTTVSSKKFTVLKSDLGSKHIIAKADSDGSFMLWEISLKGEV